MNTPLIRSGMQLHSTSLLDDDPHFSGTNILITACDEQGAFGFVTNKPFHRRFNELEEFKYCPAFPLYIGGPVDQEHIYFIHKRSDLISGGTFIQDGLYLGGDFKQAVAAMLNNTLTASDIQLFLGYCGWDKGELEAEMEEGSWRFNL
ncbi:MAG: YqgE/AlgH family protein [Chitinophagaceae bacterium]|nr:YqgE/AlgH family protein [Chitinophagaceae bacterium]